MKPVVFDHVGTFFDEFKRDAGIAEDAADSPGREESSPNAPSVGLLS